ncbi:MAG: Surface antigen protein [Deltaproteobacteria bacterium]|nr:Surface antigen protein [Deltaproteobacteria bacterium]
MVRSFDSEPPTFALNGRPIGGAQPAAAAAAHLTGARIVAIGEDALVIDADSGNLIRTDKAGKPVAQVAIGREAGLLAFDATANLAYVADRQGDKVVVVAVSSDKLQIKQTFKTPAEPFGIALSPDRKTLLVSTIADRTLVALEVTTGHERWRTALGREPRGLSIAPDGSRALVAYLATGTVDQIDLVETHRADHIAISSAAAPRPCRGKRRCSEGGSFARASFAVTFLGANQAVVPFQREVPVQAMDGRENTGSYGGGFESPVTQQVAFLGFGKDTPEQVTATISQHQPRAIVWDGAHDALYLAGLGSDSVLQLRSASQVGIAEGLTASLTTGKERCGPDGLAVTASGNLLVWCSFTRNVERLELVDAQGKLATASKITPGPSLVASRMSEPQHKGMVLFHSADPAVSQRGSMACSTCHPDNRADGLSWRIDQHALQTPVIAGRMVNTHPFKWDGTDKDLRTSLTSTMKRLGGFGLDKNQTDALATYVEGLPTVRTPSREAIAVGRGKQLFDSAELGCRTCHDGPAYTDQARHKLAGTLPESDTPSLLGLAASAPYFHDGSAVTLEALLRDRGAVHGMAETAKLSDAQVADLTAFLETL